MSRRGGLRRLVVDTRALRESPPFRRLFVGQMVSLVGRQIVVVAVPYQVYRLTGSAGLIGLIGLAQAVPLIGMSLAAGAMTDRFDRRRTLLIAQLMLGACAVGLLLVALSPKPAVWMIFALVGLQAAASAFESPVRSAIIPRLVGPDRLAGAISLNFAMLSAGSIGGPALGGLLISHVGLPAAYAVDCVTFGAALLAAAMLPPQPPSRDAAPERPWQAIRGGLAFAWRQPVILGGFVIDLAAMIFGLPRAVFPVLAATSYHTDASGLGLLYAAPAVGALAGAGATGWLSHTRRQGKVVIVAVALWGVAIVGFGLVGWLPLGLLLLVIAGAADSISAICRSTMLMELTPDPLRGRLSGLHWMVVRSGPFLGDLEAGAVAQVFGAEVSVVSGGLLCLAGLAAAAVAVPAVWHYRANRPGPVLMGDAPDAAAP